MSTELFRTAMKEEGLLYDGPIHADGVLQRFIAEGDDAPNSWYVLHADGVPAGCFGCWKRRIKGKWCSIPFQRLTPADQKELKARMAQASKDAEITEHQRRQEAALKAQEIVRDSTQCQNHPYLEHKRVKPSGELRIANDGRLIVPLLDAQDEIQTLQFIAGDGEKRFMPGGPTSGASNRIPGDPGGPIVVCEGVATGLSIAEATGFEIRCAMTSHNTLALR